MGAALQFEIAMFLGCCMGFCKGKFYSGFCIKRSKPVRSRRTKELFPVISVLKSKLISETFSFEILSDFS